VNRIVRQESFMKLVAITAGLALVASAAHAARPVKRENRRVRTVEAPYSTGLSYSIPGVGSGCIIDTPASSCILVPAGLNERFVSVEIVDATGLEVSASVGPHDDVPGGEPICGATTEPVPITPGVEVEVMLNELDPSHVCPGLATTGVVKLTLTSRP